MPQPLTSKVLLIGWDAADWKVIAPLMEAGKMPNLEKFVSEGVMGNLATLYPVLSPMLWTSIATGKRAYKHGVHGFIEPDPETGAVRPISNLARQTKAIWNILNQEGKRSNVVGWWPSEPVEPIKGVMVSNHFQSPPHEDSRKPWHVKPESVHPPRLRDPLAEFRIHPYEVEGEQLQWFVPNAHTVDQTKDKRLYSLAKIIAETATIHAAATALMQLEPWDFMGIYYDAIDHFGHGFMRYHPPRQPWVSEEDFELYKGVVEAGYMYHDAMLGVLLNLAGEDTTTIIVSDHGFHPDRLRVKSVPNEPAGPAEEHRPFGVIAMNGPGIQKNELVYGASLLDVTPTILSLLGLPIGADMDGKPLTTAFTRKTKVEFIPSWDDVTGDAAMHPDDTRVSSVNSQQALQQLVDLGYVEELSDDKEQRLAETSRELRYNLARDYFGAQLYHEAIPIFTELWEEWQDESRFGVKLFQSYLALNDTVNARETYHKIVARKQENSVKAKAELEKLHEELKDKKLEEIPRFQQRQLRKLRGKASTNLNSLAYFEGLLLLAENERDKALTIFDKLENIPLHNQPSLYEKKGEIYLQQRNWAMAESCFQYILEIDPVNPAALLGLCQVYNREQRYSEALEKGMAAIGLNYQNPKAHFFCGVALQKTGRIEEAEQAFLTAIRQNPHFAMAYRFLARLYTKDKLDLALAAEYRQRAREARKQFLAFKAGDASTKSPENLIDWYARNTANREQTIPEMTLPLSDCVVVVSGLPRSGTSMMMQMLSAGGVPIVTDNVRTADESNPKGYYEFEKAKQLATEQDWLKDSTGQAVKIVAQLLPKVPTGVPAYRIIFMERHLQEVITSQKTMLRKLKKKGAKIPDARLAQTYLRQLALVEQTLSQRDNIEVIYINYEAVVNNPATAAAKVNQFLGGSLDELAMVQTVNPNLRHQQIA